MRYKMINIACRGEAKMSSSRNLRSIHLLYILAIFCFVSACKPQSEFEKSAQHFREHHDFASLSKVVDLMKTDADSAYVRKTLGEPIDMGFDFRYLVDSTSPDKCSVGAVFHISSGGKIDQKWVGDICE